MSVSTMEIEEWLEATAPRRSELLAYSKTTLPADSTERLQDMDQLIQNEHDASVLHAEAQGYLVHAEAMAVKKIRAEHPKYTAAERKAMVKDAIRDVAELVAGLSILARTLSSRRFASMNAGRSH